MSEIPNLPTAEDYLKAVRKSGLAFRTRSDGNVDIFLADSRLLLPVKTINRTASQLARSVERVDRTTGEEVDEEIGESHALILGSVSGMLTVQEVHRGKVTSGQIHKLLSEMHRDLVTRSKSETDDKFEQLHNIAGYLIDYGQRGMEIAGPQAEDVLEDIEMRVVPDVTKQRMFRIGSGAIIHAAHEIMVDRIYRQQLDELDAALANADWDDDLQKLIRGNQDDGSAT